MTGLHFMRPELLYGLLIIPILIVLMMRGRKRVGNWQTEIDPALLPYLAQGTRSSRESRAHVVWPAILMALAITAAAGPSLQQAEVPVFQRADALVVVLDLSDSMRATDIQPSRAGRARQKVLDVLAQRQEGVTGLVAFAGDAHVVTPLTDDVRTIENLLPALTPDIMPIPGADSEAALRLAVELITTAGMANGRVLLITDGMPGFSDEDLGEVLSLANIDLAILGVGTSQGAPIPLPKGGFIRDATGEIVVPVLNDGNLQTIANALGARYRRVSLDSSDIDALLSVDATQVLSGISLDRRTDTWIDQGYLMVILIAAGMLPLFRRGALVALGCVLVAPVDAHAQGIWQDLWQTRDQQGVAALKAGDADRASGLFTDPQWRGTAQFESGDYRGSGASFAELSSADDLYNLGNSLAMTGDYASALEAYERSLAAMPDQQDAIANRDLMKQLLEQQERDAEQPNHSDEANEDQESPPQDQQSNSDQADKSESSPDDSQSSSEDSESSEDSQTPSDNKKSEQTDTTADESGDNDPAGDRDTSEERLDEQTEAQMRKFDAALEEQQKLEQWLRRVPDEPGGLLRNKFRYQSIQRLKNGEEPNEDVRW